MPGDGSPPTSAAPDGGSWLPLLPMATYEIACSGATHRVTWSAGGLELHDHAVDAEEALAVLGGPPITCIEIASAWSIFAPDANDPRPFTLLLADGVMNEHAEAQVRHRAAYSRRAVKGRIATIVRSFELAGDGAKERIDRFGALDVLLDLPLGLRQRWALEQLDRWRRLTPREEGQQVIADAHGYIAISRIAAAVWPYEDLNVGAWSVAERSPSVMVANKTAVLAIPLRWLATVWLRGIPVVDGSFVIDAEPDAGPDVRVTLVAREGDELALVPSVVRLA